MDNMEKTKKPSREKYYIEPNSFWASSAVTLMLLSALFRVIGSWGLWSESAYFYLQFLLPIGCNLVYILCILLLGKKGFFLSIIPVVFGVVFFIIKATYFPNIIHMVLCILLYVIVLIVYSFTVFGVIHTKLLLIPLFGLPLVYHILVEDMPALSDALHPVTFSAGMLEMSVLAIMASLLCVSIGLKKRVFTEPAQPETDTAAAAGVQPDEKPETSGTLGEPEAPGLSTEAYTPAAETAETPIWMAAEESGGDEEETEIEPQTEETEADES